MKRQNSFLAMKIDFRFKVDDLHKLFLAIS